MALLLNVSHENVTHHPPESGLLIPFVRIIFVLLSRAGCLVIQLGTFPTENVYNIIFQNIAEIVVSTISFSLIGFGLAFGEKEHNGIVGSGTWIGSKSVKLEEVSYGLCAVLISNSIITSALSGRLHFIASIVINGCYSGILLPSVMHWIWNKNGFMAQHLFLGYNVRFIDCGGGLVIHGTAGVVGLMGTLFLGRRLLRLNEIDESSVGTESASTTIMGYFFTISGYFAMSLPNEFYSQDNFRVVLINNFISITVGILVMILLQIIFCKHFNYWALISCIQGGIASLIVISPGVVYYSAVSSILLAAGGGMVFATVTRFINITAIEDYCNTIALNMVSGIFGTLFPQILIVTKTTEFMQVISGSFWQLLCLFVILVTFALTSSFLFAILWCSGYLRNRSDEVSHERSNIMMKNKRKTCFAQRFFNFHDGNILLEPGHSGKDSSISLRDSKHINLTGRTQTVCNSHSRSTLKEIPILTDNNSQNFPSHVSSHSPTITTIKKYNTAEEPNESKVEFMRTGTAIGISSSLILKTNTNPNSSIASASKYIFDSD